MVYNKFNVIMSIMLTNLIFPSYIFSSDKLLSTSFEIVPNSIKSNNYNAKIILKNNGSQLSNGWQINFNFSSPDQMITKIYSGVTELNTSNPITIKNLPQHTRTAPREKRIIRITVKKNSDTTPQIPMLQVTAFADKQAQNRTYDVHAL